MPVEPSAPYSRVPRPGRPRPQRHRAAASGRGRPPARPTKATAVAAPEPAQRRAGQGGARRPPPGLRGQGGGERPLPRPATPAPPFTSGARREAAPHLRCHRPRAAAAAARAGLEPRSSSTAARSPPRLPAGTIAVGGDRDRDWDRDGDRHRLPRRRYLPSAARRRLPWKSQPRPDWSRAPMCRGTRLGRRWKLAAKGAGPGGGPEPVNPCGRGGPDGKHLERTAGAGGRTWRGGGGERSCHVSIWMSPCAPTSGQLCQTDVNSREHLDLIAAHSPRTCHHCSQR